jgi:hypothetical protein
MYELQKYEGIKTRHNCPYCESTKTFTLYIDTLTKQAIAHNVGRCNREVYCGVNYTPKDYFRDNGIENYTPQKITYKPRPQIKLPSYIEVSGLNQFKLPLKPHTFLDTLQKVFGAEIAANACKHYYVDAFEHFGIKTVFWQVDLKGNFRTGKVMEYDAATLKRKTNVNWVHKIRKLHNFNLVQCFFGEHLLSDISKPIGIVESEKTAIICSILLPKLIWLAAGSSNGLQLGKCKVLEGRKVILYPDLNFFEIWNKKSAELRNQLNIDISVSDLLERKATKEEKEQGLDIADYLLKLNQFKLPKPVVLPTVSKNTPVIPEPLVYHTYTFTKKVKNKIPRSDLQTLKNYFNSITLPLMFEDISNVPKFINTHLNYIESMEMPSVQPYFDRLIELKNKLKIYYEKHTKI